MLVFIYLYIFIYSIYLVVFMFPIADMYEVYKAPSIPIYPIAPFCFMYVSVNLHSKYLNNS